MSVGVKWAWSVLDKMTRILAVAAILIVTLGGGLLLHRPAPVIVGVVALPVIAALAEGLVTATRLHEITQSRDPASAYEGHRDKVAPRFVSSATRRQAVT